MHSQVGTPTAMLFTEATGRCVQLHECIFNKLTKKIKLQASSIQVFEYYELTKITAENLTPSTTPLIVPEW